MYKEKKIKVLQKELRGQQHPFTIRTLKNNFIRL